MASSLRTRPRRVAIAAAVAVTIAMTLPAARAQPSAADRETARSLMDQGFDLRTKGDAHGSLKAFEAADALMHVPTTGLEVARSQAALDLLVEARGTALDVSHSTPAPGEPGVFAEARRRAGVLAAELERRIPSLVLHFPNAPAGAPVTVTIDGTAIPPAALLEPRRLDPGSHEVVATLDTKQSRVTVDLAEAETRTVDIAFAAAPASPPAEGPPAPAPAPETPPATPPPALEGPPSRALAWTGFSVAGAGFAVGVVTGVLAFTSKSAAENYCVNDVCSPSAHDDITTSKTMGTISTIAFGVAALGVAVGIYGLLTSGAKAPSATPARSAVLSPAGVLYVF